MSSRKIYLVQYEDSKFHINKGSKLTGYRLRSNRVFISPDNTRVVYIPDDGSEVVASDRDGKTIYGDRPYCLDQTSDIIDFAFSLAIKSERCAFVVRFSEDGSSFAYVSHSKELGMDLIVVDGATSKTSTVSLEGTPAHLSIDEDGDAVYVLRRRVRQMGMRSFLRHAGEESGPYAEVEAFALSPDRKTAAIAVSTDGSDNRIMLAHATDESSPSYWADVSAWPAPISVPTFSGDSRHVAYVSKERGLIGGVRVIVDGQPQTSLDEIPGPSADLLRLSKVSEVAGLSLNYDGGRLAYVVSAGYRSAAVVDGKRHRSYRFGPSRVLFSRDGTRYLYVAEEDKETHLVVDGEVEAVHRSIIHAGFGPSGEVAFLAKDAGGDGIYAIVAGKRWEKHQRSFHPLVFSDDGRHVGYIAGTDDEKFVVVDGRRLTSRWDIPVNLGAAVVFTAEGTIRYVAADTEGLYLVEERPESVGSSQP